MYCNGGAQVTGRISFIKNVQLIQRFDKAPPFRKTKNYWSKVATKGSGE